MRTLTMKHGFNRVNSKYEIPKEGPLPRNNENINDIIFGK